MFSSPLQLCPTSSLGLGSVKPAQAGVQCTRLALSGGFSLKNYLSPEKVASGSKELTTRSRLSSKRKCLLWCSEPAQVSMFRREHLKRYSEAGGENLYWGASHGTNEQELRALSQSEHLWHHHSVWHIFGPRYVFF